MKREIVNILHNGNYSCVIANGLDVRTFRQRGVADLYDLLQQDPQFLQGAFVADKVVGKGAAALMIKGGVKEVYTNLISNSALALFIDMSVNVEYVQSVHHIENRDKTDWCPLEKSCKGINSITDILPIIDNFIYKIRSKDQTNSI